MSANAAADDGAFARPILHALGPLREDVGREYLRRWNRSPKAANEYLRTCAEWWEQAPPLARQLTSLDRIEHYARKLAEWCARDGSSVTQVCAAFELPLPRGSENGRQARGEDFQYWRRVLRRLAAQWWDQFMRLAGFVHRHRQVYCSDQCHKWVKARADANRATLADLLALSDQGDILPLDEVVERSEVNPAHRYIEAMVRVRGLEEWANAQGWASVMATVTCPSRMHARHVKSGAANRKYDGTTPRAANDYLGRVFARVRAHLDRWGIPWAGFRAAEPHHDGCPHWHILIFAPEAEVTYSLLVIERDGKRRRVEYSEPAIRAAERIIRHHALLDSPNEPGARKRRVQFERIDPARGSAAAYLAKYIAKALDGGKNETDLMGNPAEFAAERINAWARTWRVRQFAFYGNPSVTLYREYRRLREAPPVPHAEPWAACDRYRWADFIEHQRGAFPARLVRSTAPKVDHYGDPVPDGAKPIIGIEIGSIPLATRLKSWRIERKPKPQGEALPGSVAVGPWTCVSNCTEPPERPPP